MPSYKCRGAFCGSAPGAAAFCVRAYCALVEPIFLPVQILDAEEKLLRQVRDNLTFEQWLGTILMLTSRFGKLMRATEETP